MFSFPPNDVSCPIPVLFRIVNVLMAASLAMPNSDFCASLFETQADHSLVGQVMNTSTVANKFECHQKCLGNSNCQSFNVHPAGDSTKRVCELNNKTREMKPGGFITRKGSSYYGHIKITCQYLSTNKKKRTTSPDECTFETADLCGFTNVDGDDFDWTQKMGNTPSRRTGPDTDPTTKRFGYFMYIETSWPRIKGDTAILKSKLYPRTTYGRCLHFYYHMYGEDMGTLKVIQSFLVGDDDTVLFEKSGDQGNQWILARVQVKASASPYRIKFVGIRGRSFLGDAAIDDVFFTNGICPS